jgi:hypothetical protein
VLVKCYDNPNPVKVDNTPLQFLCNLLTLRVLCVLAVK